MIKKRLPCSVFSRVRLNHNHSPCDDQELSVPDGSFPRISFTTPRYLLQFNRGSATGSMQCPNCQKDLVQIPTLEGPQLDVCPGKHGLWLDVGEVNLFVENYRALEEASQHAGAPAGSTTSSVCPRCGGLLDPKSVLETSLFACRACRGWWLPQGSLTQLNATARGGAAPIRFDESACYTQAQKRRTTSRPMESTVDSGRSRTESRAQQVWFWAIFLGGALVLACLILVAGIRKAVVPATWATAPDATLFFLALGVVGVLSCRSMASW